MLRVLDLFSGLGGFSSAFKERGHDVWTLDIMSKFSPDICVDIRAWHGQDRVWDVVLASPPCPEFSHLTKLSNFKGLRGPPDPDKGMELVREAKRVIDECAPRFWVLENVKGSIPHISKLLGPPRMIAGPYVLWGDFPERLWIPPKFKKPNSFKQMKEYWGFQPAYKDIQAFRAKIPNELSLELCLRMEMESR